MTRKGFSLIELLVVVLIMGILASVALPQYFKSVEKGRAAEAINMLSAIASAEERYILKTGMTTSKLRMLDIDFGRGYYSGSGTTYYTDYFYYAFDGCGPYSINGKSEYGCVAVAGRGRGGTATNDYTIFLSFPNPPNGERTFACTPMSKCSSFLPK